MSNNVNGKVPHRPIFYCTISCLVLLLTTVNGFGTTLIKGLQEEASSKIDSGTHPYIEAAVHDAGNIELTTSNAGIIGSNFLRGPIEPLNGLPWTSCIFPYPGGNEYLFGAALWVGAIVGQDTLVSTAHDGWNIIREMWPDSFPAGSIIRRSTLNSDPGAVSEQDFIAVYYDTLTSPEYATSDPVDGRPHIPLNLQIMEMSYAWSDPRARDLVIFEYFIKNIGENPLIQTYIGVHVDGDVGPRGMALPDCLDDISGFKKTVSSPQNCGFKDTVNLAWIADNDGRLTSGAGCPDDFVLTAVTGMRLLRAPSDSLKISYNWWTSNVNPDFDFGPRRQGIAENPFRDFGGNLGTPGGDRNKYYVMGGGEVDYDQLFTAVDHTSEGWLAPPLQAANIATGTYTRYLLSFGPFDIQPGEIVPIAMAYVGGENFHTNCRAFDSLFEAANPQAYNDQLNFSNFGLNAVMAGWIYDNPGIDTDGDGYYGKYRICAHDSILVVDTLLYPPESTYVYTSADTFYYEGDAYPDLKLPDTPTDIPGPNPVPSLPHEFSIGQNYPNPFNLSTMISYDLPRREEVSLTIYNIMGQVVRKIDIGTKPAGKHSVVWDGNNDDGEAVASGIYLYRMDAGSFTASKKMVLMK